GGGEKQECRVVAGDGNDAAGALIWSAFEVCNRKWRGIGAIPKSGLRLRWEFADFDAERRFDVGGVDTLEPAACISGQILRGLKKPHDCPAFGSACTPERPLGATMVSAEGACAAYYAYGRRPAAARREGPRPAQGARERARDGRVLRGRGAADRRAGPFHGRAVRHRRTALRDGHRRQRHRRAARPAPVLPPAPP